MGKLRGAWAGLSQLQGNFILLNLFSHGEFNFYVLKFLKYSVDMQGRLWIKHPLI